MQNNEKSPSPQELLRRIQELEEQHAHIKQEICKLTASVNHPKPYNGRTTSVSPYLQAIDGSGGVLERGVATGSSFWADDKESHGPLAMKLTETQYLNILESMGQGIHIYDRNHRIFFWNRAAENMYSYTAAEVIGRSPVEVLAEPEYATVGKFVIERALNGESWSGEFPIKNKHGEKFLSVCANTPYRDENNRVVGAMCLSSDSRPFLVMKSVSVSTSFNSELDSQQSLKTSIASKISNLASKVKSKMKTGDNYTYDEGGSDVTDQSESSTPRGHIAPSPFGDTNFTGKFTTNSSDKSENKLGSLCKTLSSKAEASMGDRGILWPGTLKERKDESLDAKLVHLCWRQFNVHPVHEPGPQISSGPSAKLDSKLSINNNSDNNKLEARELWLSDVSSTSSVRNGGSNTIIKFEGKVDSSDYEILWEDVITKEQIGKGSYGTVYHGLWYGSDVAVKLFTYQYFSDDVMVPFKQEVSLMKRLRHPNILLFMGAVTSPQHLCIVTEFLPRGSLFRILQRKTIRLDWRRRLHMAVDIVRGMNYLHHCNPPIVHRDLKSSNLLVDKNWTVKVGDFGLSRIKHQTYLKTKTGKGTPQWMAPEVLRNEQADEKSDVYSYGVVLWELTTEKIPWDGINEMQVIGTVGFMNKRLEIPKDVDPQWVSLIESCWCSKPESRPSFQEILCKLKDLQKKFAADSRR